MEVHGNLDLLENNLLHAGFGTETNFPTNPQPGRTCFKDKILYMCVEISDSIPVWVPLTKPLNLLKYSQSTPALEWTITHNLNSNYPLVQVYDTSGNWILPDSINAGTFNNVTIVFNTPTAGVAIIQRGEEDGSAQPIYAFTASFTNSATWVVAHNLGYNPIIRCFIGQNEVQPATLVHNSVNQATITFSTAQTGTVRCI